MICMFFMLFAFSIDCHRLTRWWVSSGICMATSTDAGDYNTDCSLAEPDNHIVGSIDSEITVCASASSADGRGASAEVSIRAYDFTPISVGDLVVLVVDACGIPSDGLEATLSPITDIVIEELEFGASFATPKSMSESLSRVAALRS